jgi:hypothetical protein
VSTTQRSLDQRPPRNLTQSTHGGLACRIATRSVARNSIMHNGDLALREPGGRLNCLMLKRLVTCLICFSTAQACADMSIAQCQVDDAQGVKLLSLQPLYPVKRRSHYRINQDRFIDLRYDFFTSSVAVRTTDVPRFPWTFSETVIERAGLKMSGEPTLTGSLAIDRAKSGAQVMCREDRTH